MLTNVRVDPEQKKRRVMTYINHHMSFESTDLVQDLPNKRVQINFVPLWASFYWMANGRLVLKEDRASQYLEAG
jgi:hypothetical protein